MHQERRSQFIHSQPYFESTKTPLKMWRKFFEETKEAAGAFFSYVIHPTRESRQHLAEELVDITFIVMDMFSFIGVDMNQAIEAKLTKDEGRFPTGTIRTREDYRRVKRIERTSGLSS